MLTDVMDFVFEATLKLVFIMFFIAVACVVAFGLAFLVHAAVWAWTGIWYGGRL
jgi:hypothetical protein